MKSLSLVETLVNAASAHDAKLRTKYLTKEEQAVWKEYQHNRMAAGSDVRILLGHLIGSRMKEPKESRKKSKKIHKKAP